MATMAVVEVVCEVAGSAVAEAEKRWTMRTRNWQEIMAPLSIFCQERLKDSLC